MGYTTYTCKNCDDKFISDYTDKLSHNYKAVITNPTCTEFGFTTYTCADCGDSYVADYTDKTEHNYDKRLFRRPVPNTVIPFTLAPTAKAHLQRKP